jgi:hypothetical protein
MTKPLIDLLDTTEYWLAHANAARMEMYGGSFTAGLGRLFYRADSQNAARLVRAFPHEFLEVETKEPRS